MDRKLLRTQARIALLDNWKVSICVAMVSSLLGALMVGSDFLPEINTAQNDLPPLLQKAVVFLSQEFHIGNFTFSSPSGILGFAAFFVGGVLQLGYADFLLKQHDGKEVCFKDLFSRFDRFGTGFAQYFLRGLYVVLWSLLFVIPGIIKDYSYAMTPFILAENPNLTASQAIKQSKQMMDGHKADLFLLDLSFIGWSLLASLTLNLGNILLNPYRNAARAAFYRQLQEEQASFRFL